MLNKERFVVTLTGLCDLYGKIPSEFIFDTYYAIFQDYDNQAFEGAINTCLKNRVYNTLPKPAEILEYLEGTKDDKALAAWLQAKEAVRKVGYYQTPDFQDPAISHAIVELGGWMEFCSAPVEELPFIEKRFMDLYRLFLKRGVNVPTRLIGFIELKNLEKGHNVPDPIRIGTNIHKLIGNT